MSVRQRGFTVLELIVAIIVLAVIGTVFYVQNRDLEIAKRDSLRKTAINSLYYSLEDVYYPTNKAYPEKLTADQLKGIDPAQLKDPNGKAVGEKDGSYRYEAKDCKDGKCKSYVLTADMENESDYTKESRNQ